MGFSIGVERLLEALEKEGIPPPLGGEPTVYIVTLDGRSQIKGYELANSLRSKGVKAQLNLSPEGLSSQLKLVNRKKIRWTLILGEKELKEKTVILRDMESGKQETIEWGKWDQLSKKLGDRL
jgi:histidyl-tRNA synthetase